MCTVVVHVCHVVELPSCVRDIKMHKFPSHNLCACILHTVTVRLGECVTHRKRANDPPDSLSDITWHATRARRPHSVADDEGRATLPCPQMSHLLSTFNIRAIIHQILPTSALGAVWWSAESSKLAALDGAVLHPRLHRTPPPTPPNSCSSAEAHMKEVEATARAEDVETNARRQRATFSARGEVGPSGSDLHPWAVCTLGRAGRTSDRKMALVPSTRALFGMLPSCPPWRTGPPSARGGDDCRRVRPTRHAHDSLPFERVRRHLCGARRHAL